MAATNRQNSTTGCCSELRVHGASRVACACACRAASSIKPRRASCDFPLSWIYATTPKAASFLIPMKKCGRRGWCFASLVELAVPFGLCNDSTSSDYAFRAYGGVGWQADVWSAKPRAHAGHTEKPVLCGHVFLPDVITVVVRRRCHLGLAGSVVDSTRPAYEGRKLVEDADLFRWVRPHSLIGDIADAQRR
jgi:hypothetical protein